MQVGLGAEHHAPILENLFEGLVGILEEHAGDRFDLRQKMPVQADRVNHRDAVFLPEHEVVDAVRRCDMHDTGAGFRRNEVGRQNPEYIAARVEPGEQLLVAHADEFAALDRADDLVLQVAQDLFAQIVCKDQGLAAGLDIRVVNVRVHGE